MRRNQVNTERLRELYALQSLQQADGGESVDTDVQLESTLQRAEPVMWGVIAADRKSVV